MMDAVLNGASKVNITVWARRCRSDWGRDNVLDVCRLIENGQGKRDRGYRGAVEPISQNVSRDDVLPRGQENACRHDGLY